MSAVPTIAQLLPVSADSHVVEPPNCYIDRIEPQFRSRAPYLIDDPVKGATFIVDGIAPVPIGGVASAGVKPAELKSGMVRSFDKLPRGGWDPKSRLAEMDVDGIHAEVLYPSVGMALYAAPDQEYMRACMDAYNLWLCDYVGSLPGKLFGIGQSQARTPDSLIKDMQEIKRLGLSGVMMPVMPGIEDYDSPIYAEAWEAAVELHLPLSFHVLTRSAKGLKVKEGVRGGKLNNIMSVIRENQDILGVFIFGGVFDRHPHLKIVCVEADAGWVPHYAFRMDHAYERFAQWLDSRSLSRKPSEYFFENVYLTFQDDVTAFKSIGMLNSHRLMWASDYPHADSTWPNSMQTIATHSQGLNESVVRSIVHDNVVKLYNLKLARSVDRP